MLYYYIDGKPVSSPKARDYFREAIKRHEVAGYAIKPDAIGAWQKKAYSEQAREDIHDITGILEQGGLEIVIED